MTPACVTKYKLDPPMAHQRTKQRCLSFLEARTRRRQTVRGKKVDCHLCELVAQIQGYSDIADIKPKLNRMFCFDQQAQRGGMYTTRARKIKGDLSGCALCYEAGIMS